MAFVQAETLLSVCKSSGNVCGLATSSELCYTTTAMRILEGAYEVKVRAKTYPIPCTFSSFPHRRQWFESAPARAVVTDPSMRNDFSAKLSGLQLRRTIL